MNTKHCNTCNTTKPASDFGLRAASIDGLSAKCKECQREYDKARAMAPHRVAARTAYQQTDRGKAAVARAKKRYDASPKKSATARRYAKNHPLKRAAHIILGNAVRDGKVTKMPCEKCGDPKSHGHHDDYSKPLDVRWLCPKHHKERHREMEQEGINP